MCVNAVSGSTRLHRGLACSGRPRTDSRSDLVFLAPIKDITHPKSKQWEKQSLIYRVLTNMGGYEESKEVEYIQTMQSFTLHRPTTQAQGDTFKKQNKKT